MATLIEKSGYLGWQMNAGEVEGERTANGKQFRSLEHVRVETQIGPIHWRAPFSEDAWQERDIDIQLTPLKAWDAECETNGLQIRLWQIRDGMRYVAQIRRGGRWIAMAPIGLWWLNDANERQLIGRPQAVGPDINNDRGYIRWANAFGPGLDFGYDLHGVARYFKFVRIATKADLPTPTIGTTGLKLAVVMGLAWDLGLSADNGFATGQDCSTVPDAEDWGAADEELTGETWMGFEDIRGALMWLGHPRAWDSYGPDAGQIPTRSRSIALDWKIKRYGGRVYAGIFVPATALNNPAAVYPVFIDTDVNEQVPSGTNDAIANTYNSSWDEDYTTGPGDHTCYFGNVATVHIIHAWIRFTTVAVAQGATISTAAFSLDAGFTNSDTVLSNIRGNDIDDAADIDAYAAYAALDWTTASVAWDGTFNWTQGTWYPGPEIKTILQEIVDRGGWSSGNDMAFQIADDGSGADAWAMFYGYEENAAYAAKLSFTYEAAAVANIFMGVNF